MRELMTVKDLATYLGVRPQTVYNLIKNGEAPRYINVGGGKRISIRFRKTDVEAWLDNRYQSAA